MGFYNELTGGEDVEAAAASAASSTLYADRQAQQFQNQRFAQAEIGATPYMQREFVASNRLMSELGLPQFQGEIPYDTAEETRRQQEIDALQSEIYSKNPSGYWVLEEDKRDRAKDQLRALQSEQTAYREQRSSPEALAQLGIQQPGDAYLQEAPTYQQTPAYQRLREESIAAVNQGAANTGSLYSGARGEALSEVGAGVENQFYTNYMNMLQTLANPQVTQSIGELGVNQATNIAGQSAAAQQQASGYFLDAATQAAQAKSGLTSDIIGAGAAAAGAYLGAPPIPTTGQPASTGFGGYSQTTPYTTSGFGDYAQPYDYSGHV